ncbi:MAG: phosphatase PAP2 family protein [Nitrospirae bacterium]|nr:phosphatase PAP2 family protein [Nitrospirota bacterium]
MIIQSLDTQLLLLINHGTANTLFDVLMPALTSQGYLLVLPFLLYMIVSSADRMDAQGKRFLSATLWTLVISCCAVFLAEWAGVVLKNAIDRERPCMAIEGIRLITACPKSYAMPSGHAISSFAFAVPLFYLTRDYLTMPWRIYPLVLASLIAFSRIYLGVHYPTDVLAGTLMGIMIGMLLSVLWRRIAIKYRH